MLKTKAGRNGKIKEKEIKKSALPTVFFIRDFFREA